MTTFSGGMIYVATLIILMVLLVISVNILVNQTLVQMVVIAPKMQVINAIAIVLKLDTGEVTVLLVSSFVIEWLKRDKNSLTLF